MVRQVISESLAKDPAISVLAAVADPIFAMARMRIQWPDVLVLDLALKRLDGMSFLRKIMTERPTPVIVCATSTPQDLQNTADARSAGAVDVIIKPTNGLKSFLEQSATRLVAAVKAAAPGIGTDSTAAAPVRSAPRPRADAAAIAPKNTADVITAAPPLVAMKLVTERIVAIGTSTGGTQALERVLVTLAQDCPGIVVVQHMPENFTAAFAARLNSICAVEVREAVDDERLRPGEVLIAPGGKHLMLRRSGMSYYTEVVDGPAVNRHKPSVDVLFRSVAKCAGANALVVIMTGMGDDGARGLLEMRHAGASTVAQDEESCVVFGMPKEAIKLAAVERVLPLDLISHALIAWGTTIGRSVA